MKKALAAWLLTLACIAPSVAAEPDQAFTSWYDGWGTHTIWGIGKVASGNATAAVKCGSKMIPVRVTYDTHSDLAEPTATQSPEFAAMANLALLRQLEESGNRCEFHLVPPS